MDVKQLHQLIGFTFFFLVFWVAILLPFEFLWPGQIFEALRVKLITGNWGILQFTDLAHAALFYPFGMFLEKQIAKGDLRKAFAVVTATATLAVVSEISQLFVGHRGPSISDLTIDFLGMGLGYLSAYHWRHSTRLREFVKKCRTSLVLLAGVVGVAIALLFAPIKSSFSNWDPDFPLLLANENTQNRPWLGELYEVVILGRALPGAQARQISQAQHSIDLNSHETPIIHYTFITPHLTLEAGAVSTVLEASGSEPSATLHVQEAGKVFPIPGGGIRIEGDSTLKSEGARTKIYKNFQRFGTISLVVRFKAKNLSATGPARLVSLSADTGQRNFTLGQSNDALHFRVRNLLAGENGHQLELVARGCVDPGKPQIAVAVYDGWTSRLYVDGELYELEFLTPLSIAGALFLGWAFFTVAYYFSVGHLFTRLLWRDFAAALFSVATLGLILGNKFF